MTTKKVVRISGNNREGGELTMVHTAYAHYHVYQCLCLADNKTTHLKVVVVRRVLYVSCTKNTKTSM